MTTSTVPAGSVRKRRAGRAGTLTGPSAIGLGIAVLWFSLLVLIPLALVVTTALSGGIRGFIDTISSPQTLAAVELTVVSAFLVTLLNIVMGTVIAWVLVRDQFWGKRVLDVVIDIPFALPTIVAGLVLLALYGPQSPLGVNVANTRASVALALAFVTLPFVVRTVQPVLEELEAEVEEASASLGAGRLTTFRRIVLPSLVPSIAAGAALSFARGISEYGALVLLSGNLPNRTEVVSVRVLTYIENGNPGLGGRSGDADADGRAGRHRRARRDPEKGGPPWLVPVCVSPPPVRWGLRLLAIVYVFLLVLWPVSLVVKYTFADGLTALSTALTDPDVIHSLQLTAVVALSAVLINLVFGVWMSILLVRYEFPGKRALSALLDLPLSVSPVVVGLALVLAYNPRTGLFGQGLDAAGIQVIFSTPGMIMATAFVALPLVIREVVPVLSEIGDEQEQASRSLGANALQTFRRITLPSIKWAVVYGVVLTLARSLGEFGAVKVVSGNIVQQTQTATLVVESKYQGFDQDTAYATAFLLATASVICIVVVGLLRPKDES